MKDITCPICKKKKQIDKFITCGWGNELSDFQISICKDCYQNASDKDIAKVMALFEQIAIAHKDFTSS